MRSFEQEIIQLREPSIDGELASPPVGRSYR
jgi:hypothetical protein